MGVWVKNIDAFLNMYFNVRLSSDSRMFSCYSVKVLHTHTHAHANFIIYNISLVVFMYMETKERRYRQRINKMMTK